MKESTPLLFSLSSSSQKNSTDNNNGYNNRIIGPEKEVNNNDDIEKKKKKKEDVEAPPSPYYSNKKKNYSTKKDNTDNHKSPDVNKSSSKTTDFVFTTDDDIDVEPTWMDMMKQIAPFLLPSNRKQTLFAIIGLLTMLLSKVINILPPLAIKHAVDLISENQQTLLSRNNNGNNDDDEVDTKEAMKSVLLAIGAFFGLKVASMIISSIQDVAQRIVSIDAERRFSISIFAHLHSLSLSYHLEKHIGEITNVMNRGASSISTFINSFIFVLGPTFIEVIIVSSVFWHLGTPAIAISTLSSVALYLICNFLVTKIRMDLRRKVNQADDAVNQQETETLVNYETVSMFGRTNHEINKYEQLRRNYMDQRVQLLSTFTLIQFLQQFIRLAGVCAGLCIAGRATVYSDPPLSAGSFVAIQLYIGQLFQPLTYIGYQYRMLIQAFTDLEKAVTMLNRIPDVQDAPNASNWHLPSSTPPISSSSPSSSSTYYYNGTSEGGDNNNSMQQQQTSSSSSSSSSGEIIFNNVSFHYKTKANQKRAIGAALVEKKSGKGRRRKYHQKLVDQGINNDKENGEKEDDEDNNNVKTTKRGGISNVSFHVPSGSTVALVGATGSGKTTIVRLVMRMYDSDDGIIYIDKQNIKQLKQQSLRENIGIVAQETILFNASLRDNITYGKMDATDDEIWNAIHVASLTEFVLGLPNQLDTIVGERGMKLSGGERQRVGLARCVIKNPKLILLDEATSALDTVTEREIQSNIASVCNGRTTLMIAHRLSTARHANQIIVLDHGIIVEHGTHEELLLINNGIYAKLWNAQMELSAE